MLFWGPFSCYLHIKESQPSVPVDPGTEGSLSFQEDLGEGGEKGLPENKITKVDTDVSSSQSSVLLILKRSHYVCLVPGNNGCLFPAGN